jgi:hypothetical protein
LVQAPHGSFGAQLLDGPQGGWRQVASGPSHSPFLQSLGQTVSKLNPIVRRVDRLDRKTALLVEKGNVSGQACHYSRWIHSCADGGQADLRPIAQPLLTGPCCQIGHGFSVTVADDPVGDGEQGLFQLAIATGPGEGGQGRSQDWFLATQSIHQGWGKIGLGTG